MCIYIASPKLCTLHLFPSRYANDQTARIATTVWLKLGFREQFKT